MVQQKSDKTSINRGLLIAGMLICHQPISCETWRDYIWNKLFVFKKEHIPILISSGIVLAAAVYFLKRRGGRERPRPQGMLAGIDLPPQQNAIHPKVMRNLGDIAEELKIGMTEQNQQVEKEKKQKFFREIEHIHQIYEDIKKNFSMLEQIEKKLSQKKGSVALLIQQNRQTLRGMRLSIDQKTQQAMELYNKAIKNNNSIKDAKIKSTIEEIIVQDRQNFDSLLTLYNELEGELEEYMSKRENIEHANILKEIKQKAEAQYTTTQEPLKSRLQAIEIIMRQLLSIDIDKAYETIEALHELLSPKKENFVQKAKKECTTIQHKVDLLKKHFDDALEISSSETVCQTLVPLYRHFTDVDFGINLLNKQIKKLKTEDISPLTSAIPTSVFHLDFVNQLRTVQKRIQRLNDYVMALFHPRDENQPILKELNAAEHDYEEISNLREKIVSTISQSLSKIQKSIKLCISAEVQKTSKAWKELQQTIRQEIIQWLQTVAHDVVEQTSISDPEPDAIYDMAISLIVKAILDLEAKPEERKQLSALQSKESKIKIIKDILERQDDLNEQIILEQAVRILGQQENNFITSLTNQLTNEFMQRTSEFLKNNFLNHLGAFKQLIEPSLESEIMPATAQYVRESLTKQLVEMIIKEMHTLLTEASIPVEDQPVHFSK